MDDMRRCTKWAGDRVKEAAAMRDEALIKVQAAERNLAAFSRVSFCLIGQQIAVIQAEIDGELQAKEKTP